MTLIETYRRLGKKVGALRFAEPVSHVYNPLAYARAAHELYLERFGGLGARVVMLGMNPGPFGMVQTGVPFGDVRMVRDWLKIKAKIQRPKHEHPKRPVLGFDCGRSEVSGTRLWTWAQERYQQPERFFARFLVLNYCPLCFMEESGRNRTPDKLPAQERQALYANCDQALTEVADQIRPELVVGIGAFATGRAHKALAGLGLEIGTVLHPSPASPKANRGWAGQAETELRALGIEL